MELSSCGIKDEKDFEGGSTATCVSVMESKVQILLWLLEPRVDDGSQLIKVLTVLMLRGNAERTSSFVVLISLLKPLDPSSTIYEVDLDRILQSIHVYLQELGIEEIRRRSLIEARTGSNQQQQHTQFRRSKVDISSLLQNASEVVE
ncbi:hypothetical protein Tco_0908069 [Tanacetum coccineum]|uniref:Uncharacterized protein n=1 Tax=Tanacetum coccineum TaxID=301880 RepID=A0ABQ5CSH9_9ASTR